MTKAYKPMEKKVYSTIGFNPAVPRANNDYYSTDPNAIDYLLKYESFEQDIWECAVGNGNLAQRLEEHGYNVIGSDIIDRGYPETFIMDFLELDEAPMHADIITNPPYKYVTEFVEQAYKFCDRKVAMFLKIQFLETVKRYERIFTKIPPKYIYVFVKRMKCFKNNDNDGSNSAICYAWVVWDKEYEGETQVKWIDNRKLP